MAYTISSQPRYDLFDTAADAAAGAPGEKPAVALAEPILTQCFLFRKEFSRAIPHRKVGAILPEVI